MGGDVKKGTEGEDLKSHEVDIALHSLSNLTALCPEHHPVMPLIKRMTDRGVMDDSINVT